MNADQLLAHYEKVADAPDAVQRLRRFVLDLAVRGKLVEQDPKDGSASGLLKRIAVEKLRLVKTGEIRNKPDLPEVSRDDVPHYLPSSWRWVRFGNIVDFSAGRTPSRNDTSFWNTGDYAWVSIADMENGKTVEATKETVSGKARANVFKCEPAAPGTMIMSFKLTIGKIGRLRIPAFHNEAIISIRPHLNEFDPFLFKLLPDLARGGDTKGAIKGATLNRESISNIFIPLPPLAEQHRIVAEVDKLMALCDRLEAARAEREATRDRLSVASLARLNAPDPDPAVFQDHAAFALDNLGPLTTRPDQVNALRQTILNLAVRGKLVEQDPEDEPASELIARISMAKSVVTGRKRSIAKAFTPVAVIDTKYLPPGWTYVCLDNLAVSMKYGTSIKCDYDEAHTPVLRIPNVSSGQICLDDLKFGLLNERDREALALIAGDLLMIRSNGSLNIVGRSAVVTPDAEGMCFAGYLVRLRTLNEQLNTRYVWLALNSDTVREQIERPIRSAVGLKNVNLTEFGNLSFWIPPLAEQHCIVAKVNELMALCDRLEANLSTSYDTRRRLLDAMLYGALAPSEYRERAG